MALTIKTNKTTAGAGKAAVSTEIKEKQAVVKESVKQEEVTFPSDSGGVLAANWCQVGVECGYTHNLGNFQSARVSVMLTIPCPHDEINTAYDFAKTWVNDRLEKAIEEISGE